MGGVIIEGAFVLFALFIKLAFLVLWNYAKISIEILRFGQCVLGIIEWFGLEGIFKIMQVQSLCHGQGHLPLDQVVQSLIQPGLEGFKRVFIS